MNRAVKMPYSGSILAIQCRIYTSSAGTLVLDVFRNTNQSITVTQFTILATDTSTYQNGKTTFTRGNATFNAEDVVYISLRNPPAGANIQVEADLIVDYVS